MLKNLFKRGFAKRGTDDLPADQDALSPVVRRSSQGLVHVNVDAFDADQQNELYDELARRGGITVYEGHVEHAYSKRKVSDIHRCPRCRAKTEPRYASFVYATQVAPRVMFAPAGHFCTNCPCVIVDEDMIKTGILNHEYRYQGSLAIDYRGKKEPDILRTWNGQDAVYVFDEDQRPLGITAFDRPESYSPAGLPDDARAQRKRHHKRAKQSRKRNRRR